MEVVVPVFLSHEPLISTLVPSESTRVHTHTHTHAHTCRNWDCSIYVSISRLIDSQRGDGALKDDLLSHLQ